MASEIFVTFPELGSQTENTSSLFVEKDSSRISDDHLKKIVSLLDDTVGMFDIEEVLYYYDNCNVKKYLEFFANKNEYPVSARSVLRRVLYKSGFNDIRNEIQAKTTDKHIIYYNKPNDGVNILREVATKQIANPNNSYLIVNDTMHSYIVPAKVNGCSTDLHLSGYDFGSVFLWMSKNRKPPRLYNWNPKHGENGKNVLANKNEYVSPLLCSKEHACELLKYAIGSKKRTTLYVYDTKYKYFMEYRKESDNVVCGVHKVTYHSYHLVKNEEKGTDIDKKFDVLNKYNVTIK